MVRHVLEWVFWALLMGTVPFALYTVAQVSRRQQREVLHFLIGTDALERLESLSRVAAELPAPVKPFAPFALLTTAQAAEVQELRGCGFTWEEIAAYSPMFELDARAVQAERERIEEAFNEQA